MTVTYNLHYQHYTLYYYDRGGNLTKTVSPEGVDRLLTKPAGREDTTNYTLATTYDYNTLKQLVRQNTPDGGTSNFVYNNLGQLRFSQNARQQEDSAYSYSKYDYLGRITEVGESSLGGALSFVSLDDSTYLLADTLTGTSFPLSGNTEQTWTFYSSKVSRANYMGVKSQRFLQNRVSYTATHNKNGDTSYTCFSYDPHGNVEWLQQDIPGFSSAWLAYEYDLISAKAESKIQ
jgi:YD repeat-containing protein